MKLKNFIVGLSLFLSTSSFVIASDDMKHSNNPCPELSKEKAQKIINKGSGTINGQKWQIHIQSDIMFQMFYQKKPNDNFQHLPYEISTISQGSWEGDTCLYNLKLVTTLENKARDRKSVPTKDAKLLIKKSIN